MLTFWRSGYETSSIVDLTTAMGISAPSLYTAFGDKKQLFLEAVRRYAGDPAAIEHAIDSAATARDAARDLLTSSARIYTGETTPKGCLLASATASGSVDAADVRDVVADIRRRVAVQLRKRIERDVEAGILPSGSSANALSGLVMAVSQGMSVLARDGARRASLLAIVDAAMQAWPSE